MSNAPSKPEPSMKPGSTPNVLFLCTGNSARSILAEAMLNRLANGAFHAYSAGSKPVGTVNPNALRLLQELGHDVDAARSKSWDEFSGTSALTLDIVITVCGNAASETCPIWTGTPLRAHWGMPDPAAVNGSETQIRTAFLQTYAALLTYVTEFLDLPHATASRAQLQAMLDEIGSAQ